jgi:Tfp pilus assembly protein FimT
LIEMTIVITILALFAAAVMPALANWRAGDAYRAFPGQLLRLIANARQDAIYNHVSRSLSYDATSGAFKISWTDPTTAQPQDGATLTPPSGIMMGRMVYLDNDTSPQNWKVTFYPDGTAENAGFELQDQDKYTTIAITDAGKITLSNAALPEPDTIRWSAGVNEVRTQ